MDEKLFASLGMLSAIGITQINPELLLNIVSSLSIIQVLALVIRGSVLIDRVRLEGWREKIPIYLFKCNKHGYQLSYPQGHMLRLNCPKCIKEANQLSKL